MEMNSLLIYSLAFSALAAFISWSVSKSKGMKYPGIWAFCSLWLPPLTILVVSVDSDIKNHSTVSMVIEGVTKITMTIAMVSVALFVGDSVAPSLDLGALFCETLPY